MTKLPPIAPLRVRRRRRVRKRTILLGIVAVLAVAFVGGYIYLSTSASQMVRLAKEEADRLDPGWTLGELEARREAIPDAENSAWQVDRVVALLSGGWPPSPRIASATPPGFTHGTSILGRLIEVAPEVRLGVPLTVEVRAELSKVGPAVIEARKLADMPRGRFPVEHAPNPNMPLLPQAQAVRNVGRLLWADAYLRAEDGDVDGALESCRAIVNAARSLDDDPIGIVHLVRIAVVGVAARTIERVLAQGEASEEALAKVQALLAEEAKYSPALASMRGERAGTNDLLEKLTSGELDINALNGMMGTKIPPRLPLTTTFYQYNHALLLQNFNRAVEIAKRPDPEQLALWKAWDESSPPPDRLLMKLIESLNQVLLPGMRGIGEAHLYHHGTIASTLAMVAVERHRMAHGAPPGSFAEIDPKFAGGLIGDPFVGGPVKFKAGPGSIVLYTVGADAKDDGGKLATNHRRISRTDWGATWRQPRERRKPAKDELPKNVFQTPGRNDHDEADSIP